MGTYINERKRSAHHPEEGLLSLKKLHYTAIKYTNYIHILVP